jgi:hypothetical protein
MPFFESLTHDQRENIISLPYRVGLWVSRCDDTGGDQSDIQETRALHSILYAFAEDMFGSEDMQKVMSATLSRKDDWQKWGAELKSVPADCEAAINVINEHDRKDANVFRNHLIEIGEAVALAFHEEIQTSFVKRLKMYFEFISAKSKRKSTRGPQTFDEYTRISDSERKALSALAQSLGALY